MNDNEENFTHDLEAVFDNAANRQDEHSLEIDVERYQAYLDDPDLTSDQKAEIIGTLWTIISAFVELGFGVHPVQLACGKHGTELENTGNSESTGVLSNQGKQQEIDAPAL